MEYTSDRINYLQPNEIFVFGSNRKGAHGAGAAWLAYKKFGARMGQGDGLQGQSYGIETKDKNIKTLSLSAIGINISRYLRFAKANPQLKFYTTAVGTGLAGLKYSEIASLFKGQEIPSNVILPIEFWSYILGASVESLRRQNMPVQEKQNNQ